MDELSKENKIIIYQTDEGEIIKSDLKAN